MKRIIAALLLAGIVLSLVSCMNRNKNSTTASSSQDSTMNSENILPGASTTAEGVLEQLYGIFLGNMLPVLGVESVEEAKSYFVGPETETVTERDEDTGEEFSYEKPKNEPGEISLNDVEGLQTQTLFPADSVDKIHNAAIFYNLMNMNNGTFSAFKVKNKADLQEIANQIQHNIKNNQWICGFPEYYVIMHTDDVLICAYGLETSLRAWKSAVTSTYVNAEILHEAAL